MSQDERYAASVFRPLVDEVDVRAIELGTEMTELIQFAPLCGPIEPVRPISKQLFKVIKIHPLFRRRAWCFARPASVADAVPEIGEDFFLDFDRERNDFDG